MRIVQLRFRQLLRMLLLLTLALTGMAAPAAAAEKSAAQLLPDSTLLYATVPRPAELLDTVWNHPLRNQVEALDVYKQSIDTDGYRQFRIGLALIETAMGMNWRLAWKKLTGEGIHVAFDARTNGLVLLVKASDPESQRRTMSLVIQNLKGASGKEGQFKEYHYRGITAYETGDFVVAVAKPWLILGNKGDLVKKVVDLYLDGGEKTLAASEEFRRIQAAQEKTAVAWAYLQIQGLRDAGLNTELLQGKSGNPLVEVLVGGLLDNLRKTPYATAALHLDDRQLQLSVKVPHQQDWITEPRHYYFGPAAEGQAPARRKLKETVFSFSTYRNLEQMWLYSPDLYDDNVNDQLAQAEAGLSTFLGGRDFAEDILAAFQPQLQLVVTRQTFSREKPVPAIRLPAFALDLRMKKPETTTTEMRSTFLSLIGFVNIIGAMNGQPQLDFDILKENGKTIITSHYLASKQLKKPGKAPINYNFSPTVTFEGERFIVSSTLSLARELMVAPEAPRQKVAASGKTNTAMQLQASTLKQILADNQQQLVAHNMLEDGHSKEEAEREIGLILDLIDLVGGMTVELIHRSDQLELKSSVLLKPGK